jgi:choline dehydrogenase-like flavoprotein
MSTIRDGKEIRGSERLDCDVLIIGSGAGGAASAYELASAGRDVLVLEAGPHMRPQDFTQRELDTIRRIYVDRGAQGPADGSLAIYQGSCVGGSTVINAEICFRTPEEVLVEWAKRFGVPDMSPSELVPVFEEVEKMVNVTPNEQRFLAGGKQFDRALRAVGIEPKPLARNVKGCRGCQYCLFGCAYGCKQSMDQSYLPAAMRKGARVISEARVEGLDLDGGAARGARARTPNGILEVRAKAVVVACGAIATPLLLMDHGLGGSEVGRHLSVHPVVAPTGWYDDEMPERVDSMAASYTDAFVSDGYLVETATGSPAFVAQFAPGFGRAHKELVRNLKHSSFAGGVIRDRHGPGRVLRDKKGKKVIEYALDEASKIQVRKAMKKISEIAFAGGARKVSLPTVAPFFLESTDDLRRIDSLPLGPADITLISYHPQGTARFGSVTDYDGAVRGAKNLYVMDASLFPTPVGVNPQISIMTVATVLARKLAPRVAAA